MKTITDVPQAQNPYVAAIRQEFQGMVLCRVLVCQAVLLIPATAISDAIIITIHSAHI